jgi:hypothetical protein
LPAAGASQFIELGLAVVVGRAPLGRDEALLLQLEERGVERAVVDGEEAAAGLLDAARDAVAVQRPHRFESLKDHQGERALLDIHLVGHSGASYCLGIGVT